MAISPLNVMVQLWMQDLPFESFSYFFSFFPYPTPSYHPHHVRAPRFMQSQPHRNPFSISLSLKHNVCLIRSQCFCFCFHVGIWIRDIRMKSGLVLTSLNKILKSLESKKLIKAVKSVSVRLWDVWHSRQRRLNSIFLVLWCRHPKKRCICFSTLNRIVLSLVVPGTATRTLSPSLSKSSTNSATGFFRRKWGHSFMPFRLCTRQQSIWMSFPLCLNVLYQSKSCHIYYTRVSSISLVHASEKCTVAMCTSLKHQTFVLGACRRLWDIMHYGKWIEAPWSQYVGWAQSPCNVLIGVE